MTLAKISNPTVLKLLVIGSAGHASVLMDAIELAGGCEIAGYADDTLPVGTIRSRLNRAHALLARKLKSPNRGEPVGAAGTEGCLI